jgi:2-iminobutanoate/2-iminopropanoate deaminase
MKKVLLLGSLLLLFHAISAQDQPADKPVAPYSPAVMTSGGLLFISGQIPLHPETGKLMKGDITGETRIVMDRIGRILAGHGMDFSNLVKCTIFLTDIRDYQAVNEIYRSYFESEYPAREAIEVANLPLGASIEISGIAAKR